MTHNRVNQAPLGNTGTEMDFSCQYSSNLPAVLKAFNVSLAFTSYQTSRLMLVRTDGERLDVNFKRFPRPMGLAVTDRGLTLGIFTQIVQFQREDGLLQQIKQPLKRIEEDRTAPRLKKDTDEAEEEPLEKAYMEAQHAPVDDRVDRCFITRSTHYTGMINTHDIAWGTDGLWVVNSSFSCLSTLDANASFIPRWKPYFISRLAPEDRCHLNGMTLKDGKPAFVTTFSTYDQPGRWRDGPGATGTLMSVAQNEILLDGLTMPHSPYWYQGAVYYCNSGLGEICRYDPATGKNEVLAEVPGFTRGVDFIGSIMVVGLSRIRQSHIRKPAPLAKKYDETHSGLWFFNLEDGCEIGRITFTGNVDQIYDVAVIDHCTFPEVIEPSHPRMRNHFTFPALCPETV
ncbi:TIGR03032 family protein [Marinimicrobium sp. ARAG 43.8]|uniref:TIGR03032 family protein n=1 Tax=Marinimicrobium sp. ARAG 43.8 TaxID=3418719 RepID=UPI003CF5E004